MTLNGSKQNGWIGQKINLLDGFLIAISKSGQVIYCSENVTPVLGHTPENIMNESFFQLVHEAERSEIFQKLSQGQHSEQTPQPSSILQNNTENHFPVPQGKSFFLQQRQFKRHRVVHFCNNNDFRTNTIVN